MVFASVSVSKLFDNGKHEINGNYNGENNTFNPATLTVNIDRTPLRNSGFLQKVMIQLVTEVKIIRSTQLIMQ